MDNIPGFISFLKSISHTQNADNTLSKVFVSESQVSKESVRNVGETKKYYFFYDPNQSLTLDSIKRIIGNNYRKHEITFNDDLINHFLLVYSELKKEGKSNDKELINEIFTTIQGVSIAQYYLLPGLIKHNKYNHSFGRFYFGRLRSKKFQYRCEKATTDYYELYESRLKNRISIEREFFEENVIIWPTFQLKGYNQFGTLDECILRYYESKSMLLFDQFWQLFMKDQYIQIAQGLDFLDPKYFALPESDMITLYTNVSYDGRRGGYCVPTTVGSMQLRIDPEIFQKVKYLEDGVKKTYNEIIEGDNTFSPTLQSYIQFVAKAEIFKKEGRINESFLHYVIAIEVCFGDRNASVQSVSNRVAVLTYKTIGNSFDRQRKIIKDIYGERSKYVHSGLNVRTASVNEIEKVVRIILAILFERMTLHAAGKAEFDFESWSKKLDAVAASLDAGLSFQEETLNRLSIKAYTIIR